MAKASVSTELLCGVPQGYIIGPSRFIAYTEDIQEVICVCVLLIYLLLPCVNKDMMMMVMVMMIDDDDDYAELSSLCGRHTGDC